MKLAPVCVPAAAANPVPVTVTLAVAVAVEVPGAYCTMMVQLLPGFTTKPDTQVPPAMIVNVPPAVPTLVIVGFAVKVNGAADAAGAVPAGAMFDTVIVLVDPDVSKSGRGAEIARVAPVTWNAAVKVAVDGVPEIGVVTDTFLAVSASAAPAVMVQLALTVVAAVPVIAQLTPVPLMVTAVAPDKLVPVRVTGTVVPRSPLVGLMLVSVDPFTVKGRALLATPFTVIVTFLVESAAALVMVKVAVTTFGL